MLLDMLCQAPWDHDNDKEIQNGSKAIKKAIHKISHNPQTQLQVFIAVNTSPVSDLIWFFQGFTTPPVIHMKKKMYPSQKLNNQYLH